MNKEFPIGPRADKALHPSASRIGLSRQQKLTETIFQVSCYFEVTDHHFIPAVRTEANRLGRIGIKRIGGGIVEMRGTFNAAPGRQAQRSGEIVGKLPVVTVMGNAQQRLSTPIGKDDPELEGLSPPMHMRKQ